MSQPDHAALAARIMRAWTTGTLPTRPTRDAVLFATEHHDIGWTDDDAAPTFDETTGRPHDFVSIPLARRHQAWHRALATLAPRSTYAAALVAQHALTVYRRFLHDPEWTGFLGAMATARDDWYGAASRPDGSSGGALDPQGADRLQFLSDYGTLRLGDVASLIVCNGWTAPHEQEGARLRLEADTLVVTPDPFGGRVIDLEVPARRLSARRYASDDDFRAAWASAPIEVLRARMRGADEAP
jgi:hypothetical protein